VGKNKKERNLPYSAQPRCLTVVSVCYL
jgi:hypothetical protein